MASGALVALFDAGVGGLMSGVGFLGAAAWLARYDVARRTVKIPGLTRYMASALLLGYGWLAGAGVIWITGGLAPGSLTYDAAVHSVFLGFVFSMVFAHAPIIVPAVTRQAVPYHRWFWAPLLLLHATLALRVAADFSGAAGVRQWGGLGNSLAIALFLGVLGSSVARGRRPT